MDPNNDWSDMPVTERQFREETRNFQTDLFGTASSGEYWDDETGAARAISSMPTNVSQTNEVGNIFDAGMATSSVSGEVQPGSSTSAIEELREQYLSDFELQSTTNVQPIQTQQFPSETASATLSSNVQPEQTQYHYQQNFGALTSTIQPGTQMLNHFQSESNALFTNVQAKQIPYFESENAGAILSTNMQQIQYCQPQFDTLFSNITPAQTQYYHQPTLASEQGQYHYQMETATSSINLLPAQTQNLYQPTFGVLPVNIQPALYPYQSTIASSFANIPTQVQLFCQPDINPFSLNMYPDQPQVEASPTNLQQGQIQNYTQPSFTNLSSEETKYYQQTEIVPSTQANQVQPAVIQSRRLQYRSQVKVSSSVKFIKSKTSAQVRHHPYKVNPSQKNGRRQYTQLQEMEMFYQRKKWLQGLEEEDFIQGHKFQEKKTVNTCSLETSTTVMPPQEIQYQPQVEISSTEIIQQHLYDSHFESGTSAGIAQPQAWQQPLSEEIVSVPTLRKISFPDIPIEELYHIYLGEPGFSGDF